MVIWEVSIQNMLQLWTYFIFEVCEFGSVDFALFAQKKSQVLSHAVCMFYYFFDKIVAVFFLFMSMACWLYLGVRIRSVEGMADWQLAVFLMRPVWSAKWVFWVADVVHLNIH